MARPSVPQVIVHDNAWGNNPNKNLMHLISQTNGLAIRLGYQF